METLQTSNDHETPLLEEGGETNGQSDELLNSLDTIRFSNKREVVELFDKIAGSEGQNTKALLNALASKGFSSHEFPLVEEIDRSNGESFANGLIGQALHELETHGHVANPVEFHSEVQAWRNDFANMNATDEQVETTESENETVEENDESDVDKAA